MVGMTEPLWLSGTELAGYIEKQPRNPTGNQKAKVIFRDKAVRASIGDVTLTR